MAAGRTCGRLCAVFVCLGVGFGGFAGWVVDPSSSWLQYYLSSLFQGFATFTGIVATGALVAYQLATQEYGSLIAAGHLARNSSLWRCLGVLGLVSLLSAIGLVCGNVSCLLARVLAGASFAAAFVSSYLTWAFLRNFGATFSPRAVIRELVIEMLGVGLQSFADAEPYHERVSHAFRQLLERGTSAFREGWEGYRVVVEEVLEGPRESQRNRCALLFHSLTALLRVDRVPELVGQDVVSLVYKALSLKSPGTWFLANSLNNMPEAMRQKSLERGLPAVLIDFVCALDEKDRVLHARRFASYLALWWRMGLYQAALKALMREGLISAEKQLLRELPKEAEGAPDTTVLTDALCRMFGAYGVSEAEIRQVVDDHPNYWN